MAKIETRENKGGRIVEASSYRLPLARVTRFNGQVMTIFENEDESERIIVTLDLKEVSELIARLTFAQ